MKKVFFVLAICLSISFSVSAKDRALLIGVDVYRQAEIPPTKGSTEDADALRQLLIGKFNFAPNSITVLKIRKRRRRIVCANSTGSSVKLVRETEFFFIIRDTVFKCRTNILWTKKTGSMKSSLRVMFKLSVSRTAR
jgi:hypothetical protein